MRWPFGPPHLTLKSSKKKPKQKQKNKKKTKKETNKTNNKKNKKKKNTKIPKKELFNYQSKFPFFGGCPKPFWTTWARKRRTPKTL